MKSRRVCTILWAMSLAVVSHAVAVMGEEAVGRPLILADVSAMIGGTSYWRVPATVGSGEYYVGFRIEQKGQWQNEIDATTYHNARNFRVLSLTDPKKLDSGAWEADVYAEKPLRLAPNDVISARIGGAKLKALVLHRDKPGTGHLKIGTSSWGINYYQPFKPTGINTAIASGPDANRSGEAIITVYNYTEKPADMKVWWQVKDFFGEVLDKGSAKVKVRSIESKQFTVPYQIPQTSSHVLVTGWVDDGTGTVLHHTADVVADRVSGPRPLLDLSGSWDFAEGDPLFMGDPPQADKFAANAVTVPGYMPLDKRGAKHVGWYRKTFTLPEWHKAQRRVLVLGPVAYECDVYVNGKKVGGNFGPLNAFEIDVTDDVKCGQNELVIGVRDWVAAVEAEALRKKIWVPGQVEIGAFRDNLVAPSWDATGGIKDEVHLEGRSAVHVADVFVKPSFRKNSLAVDVTIVNRSAENVNVTPVCTVRDAGKEVLRFSGEQVALDAGAETTVTLQSPADGLQPWFPHDPHLLQCSVSLDGGKDAVNVRFGFREVWLEGNKFLFNGRVAKMTRRGYNPYSPNHMNRRVMREMATSFNPPFGVTIVEVGPMRITADICDEEGLLWDLETNQVVVMATTVVLTNDTYWKNAEEMAVRTARTYRNHPCVVHYDHSNEFACFSPYTNVPNGYEAASKRLYGIYQAVQAVDPTRPASCDADGDLNGRLPDFNLHYTLDNVPGMFINNRAFLMPVDAFNGWFEKPSPNFVPQKGDVVRLMTNGLPMTWEFGTRAVYAPEIMWCPFSWLPHGGTFWKGDSVYRSTYECYQAEVDRIVNLVAGHRHLEMWLLHPWTGQGPTYDALEPDTVIPIQTLGNYYSDEKVVRAVNIHHDKLFPAEMTLRWGVQCSEGDKESGSDQLSLDAGALLRRTLEFSLPQVSEPTRATLYYRLEDKQGEVNTTTQAITIFPRVGVKVPLGTHVALWDPAGTTERAMWALGAEVVPLCDLANIPEDTNVIVVGAGAWTKDNCDATAETLFDFVEKGGTLLILHQTAWPEWSPVQMAQDSRHVASRVWKRVADHPVFRGIEDSWLRSWRESHVVSSYDFAKPLQGNAIALADSGTRDGLERCALMEVRYGSGRIIASQFRLIEAFDVEPAASRLLGNLLSVAVEPGPALGPIAVCDEPTSAVVRMLKGLGADITMLARPFDAAALNGHNLILVQLYEKLSATEANALHKAAADGATVWVRGVAKKTLPVLQTLTGTMWKQTAPLDLWQGRGLIEGAPAELAGLSNAEFYWKRGQFGDTQGLEKPSWKITDIADVHVQPAGLKAAQELVYPGLIWSVPVGAGSVIIDQVLWAEKVNEVQNQALRIASAMLTNAGVKLAAVAKTAKLPADVVWEPYDLSPYGNMGFADPVESDGKGGWSDQGPLMDMHQMPTGDVVFNGIDFSINPDKGCLTLRGGNQGKPDAFPLEITGIAIDKKVLAFELLHSGAWVSDSKEVFRMVVSYEDNTERVVRFVGGINTRDWTFDPNAPFPMETETQTRIGWTGKGDKEAGDVFDTVSVWQSRWVNPTPEKKVTSIAFVHEPASVAIICGLTLGVEGSAVPVQADQRTPEQLLEAARAAWVAGKLDEAVQTAQILVQKAPDATENWNLLGDLYREAGDKQNALQVYQKSLDIQLNQPATMTKARELQMELDASK